MRAVTVQSSNCAEQAYFLQAGYYSRDCLARQDGAVQRTS